MRSVDQHVSREDLLLYIDGQMSSSKICEVTDHLAACWDCRAMRTRMEATILNFVDARHAMLDRSVEPDPGRRALLKAHLADLASAPHQEHGFYAMLRSSGGRILAIGVAVVLLAAFGLELYWWKERTSFVALAQPLTPSHALTPGATRSVSVRELCDARGGAVDQTIPAAMQRQVFREYGIDGAPAHEYEVDYLITPELGGATEIRNLWPESYHTPMWNARVKDQLEDRLHQMVCNGEIDLPTAQQEIAVDWIAAYKKYFRTDRPL
jgi:hypothetical protein